MNFRAEKKKCQGGPHITGDEEGGKERRGGGGCSHDAQHLLTWSLLSIESQVHHQTETIFPVHFI